MTGPVARSSRHPEMRSERSGGSSRQVPGLQPCRGRPRPSRPETDPLVRSRRPSRPLPPPCVVSTGSRPQVGERIPGLLRSTGCAPPRHARRRRSSSAGRPVGWAARTRPSGPLCERVKEDVPGSRDDRNRRVGVPGPGSAQGDGQRCVQARTRPRSRHPIPRIPPRPNSIRLIPRLVDAESGRRPGPGSSPTRGDLIRTARPRLTAMAFVSRVASRTVSVGRRRAVGPRSVVGHARSLTSPSSPTLRGAVVSRAAAQA